jgi:hypothetical protein
MVRRTYDRHPGGRTDRRQVDRESTNSTSYGALPRHSDEQKRTSNRLMQLQMGR